MFLLLECITKICRFLDLNRLLKNEFEGMNIPKILHYVLFFRLYNSTYCQYVSIGTCRNSIFGQFKFFFMHFNYLIIQIKCII